MYPGSDTSIIMDLFAWTFDVLTYILNNNASDSLFADTMIYQNMNRIVKLLAYNPDGYHTSNTLFRLNIANEIISKSIQMLPDNCIIPKFTSIDLGKTDKNGNPIKYSFINDYNFSVYNTSYGTNSTIITPEYWPTLYNGEFKKYPIVFRSTGIPYVTFLLDEIGEAKSIYVDHDCFHVYIETIDENTGAIKYQEWKKVDNLVLDSTFNDKTFELRFTEKKQYILTFGDDIHGKKLKNGDKIHIIYLQTNLQEGKIQNGQVSESSIEFKVTGFKNNTELLDMCFGGIDAFKRKYKGLFVQNNVIKQNCSKLTLTNIKESSEPKSFEEVESIRFNAPGMFRMGNRLVTINDYKIFSLSKFSNLIQDCWVCNNTTYMSTFYQWLNNYNRLTVDIRKYNYLYCDTCDFNNIYIWVKSRNKTDLSNTDMNYMISKYNKIKTATTEIVPCNAIIKYYMPYVDHIDYPADITEIDLGDWNPNIKIRITKKADTYFTNAQIKSEINKIITDYFKIENQKLGNTIKIDEIYHKIMNLGYIESVKTVNIPKLDQNNEYIIDGLSFACFSVKLIQGADFDVVKYNDQLLPFQFAQLYSDSIINNIEIVNGNTFSLVNSEF